MEKFCAIVMLIALSCLLSTSLGDEDLYRILGVRKSASDAEIKKAYKKMAREWHPDKNKEEGATEKFMKINEAYETLSDKEKRRQYDKFGTTSAQAEQRNPFQGNPFGRSPFEEFFHGSPFGGFNFNFGGRDSPFSKNRITLRVFQNSIIPESKDRPYLIFAYSEFCYECMEVEMIWDRLVADAEATGMGIATIHVQLDHALANRARSPPGTLSVAIYGKLRYYSGRFSVSNIRGFIKNLLPPNLVIKLTDENYMDFINGWKDNKVRAIFFAERQEVTMRYLLPAFGYRDRIAVGYVNIASQTTTVIQNKYNVPSSRETLLMFNEDTKSPMVTLSTSKLAQSSINEVFETNKFLSLPRLSSQKIFLQLCPMSPMKKNKKLCVVLLTKNIPEHDPHRESFRQYALKHQDKNERVKYTYIYEDTQGHFVESLTRGSGIANETNLKVALISRTDEGGKVRFEIMHEGWPPGGDQSEIIRRGRLLHRMVDWFLSGSEILPFYVNYPHDLIDEQADSLLVRIWQRLQDWAEIGWEKLMSMDEMTVITMFMTLGLLLVTGFVMHTLSSMECQKIRPKGPRSSQRSTQEGTVQNTRPTVYMHELNAETFDYLALQSPPGVRIVVVLVDEERKTKLLQQFAHFVLPYSRGEAFKFAFLQLERYLPWYRTLLEETLEFKRDLSGINMKNCIGTVISLNGPRKYYCIYHAQEELFKLLATKKPATGGRFMGFDEDSDNELTLDDKIFESDLLGKLGNWMDRLCEGSLRRFRVDNWPSMAEHSN